MNKQITLYHYFVFLQCIRWLQVNSILYFCYGRTYISIASVWLQYLYFNTFSWKIFVFLYLVILSWGCMKLKEHFNLNQIPYFSRKHGTSGAFSFTPLFTYKGHLVLLMSMSVPQGSKWYIVCDSPQLIQTFHCHSNITSHHMFQGSNQTELN